MMMITIVIIIITIATTQYSTFYVPGPVLIIVHIFIYLSLQQPYEIGTIIISK